WASHVRNMAVSDYNHHTSTTEKEMALELVHPIDKRTLEGMPIYIDEVKVKLEKVGLLQLFKFSYFGKTKWLYQWLISSVHEDQFYFAGHIIHINPQLISKFTSLISKGDSLDDDLEDKEAIKKTIEEYDYKK
ncbi:hypothetical protein KI387_009819, partial [Taxus chinensis]